jgi:hypothetical protein
MPRRVFETEVVETCFEIAENIGAILLALVVYKGPLRLAGIAMLIARRFR